MAKIVWEGNRKEFGTSHRSPPVPQNAIIIRERDGLIKKAIPFGILPMVMCMVAVVMKAYLNKEPPVSPLYLIPAIAIGLSLLFLYMSLHTLFAIRKMLLCGLGYVFAKWRHMLFRIILLLKVVLSSCQLHLPY